MSEGAAAMRRVFAAVAASALFLVGLALPASATTDSGTINCSNIAYVGVHGEQQRLDRMVFKVQGITIFDSSHYYIATRHSTLMGTRSWSAHADTLLLAPTKGYCEPA